MSKNALRVGVGGPVGCGKTALIVRHILQEKSKKLSVIFAVSKKKSIFVLDFSVINDTKIE